MVRVLSIFLLASCLSASEVDAVKAEPNLEKRSALALDQVSAELDRARQAYTEGHLPIFEEHIKAAGDLAELSYQSLQDSGKRARRSPKWFKRAELKLSTLLRRIDSLDRDVALEDRKLVESLRGRVRDVHDHVLHDIMSNK